MTFVKGNTKKIRCKVNCIIKCRSLRLLSCVSAICWIVRSCRTEGGYSAHWVYPSSLPEQNTSSNQCPNPFSATLHILPHPMLSNSIWKVAWNPPSSQIFERNFGDNFFTQRSGYHPGIWRCDDALSCMGPWSLEKPCMEWASREIHRNGLKLRL